MVIPRVLPPSAALLLSPSTRRLSLPLPCPCSQQPPTATRQNRGNTHASRSLCGEQPKSVPRRAAWHRGAVPYLGSLIGRVGDFFHRWNFERRPGCLRYELPKPARHTLKSPTGKHIGSDGAVAAGGSCGVCLLLTCSALNRCVMTAVAAMLPPDCVPAGIALVAPSCRRFPTLHASAAWQ